MPNITTIGDAIVEFNRTVTYTFVEASTKILQDYKRLNELIMAAHTRLAEEFGIIAYNNQLNLFRKAYTETLVDAIHIWARKEYI